MYKQDQSKRNLTDILPPWTVDPEVKEFLEFEGFELVIFQDEKYRRGSCNKPLIVLRRIYR